MLKLQILPRSNEAYSGLDRTSILSQRSSERLSLPLPIDTREETWRHLTSSLYDDDDTALSPLEEFKVNGYLRSTDCVIDIRSPLDYLEQRNNLKQFSASTIDLAKRRWVVDNGAYVSVTPSVSRLGQLF